LKDSDPVPGGPKNLRIRIKEALKHPDPEHCQAGSVLSWIVYTKAIRNMDINNWFFHRQIEIDCLFFSVADPGCLSRIPDPNFYPSRITDPKTVTKERGEKNLLS
jgi:hypothetical protein